MNRKISIKYESEHIDMDMLDGVLKRFNQDLTIKELRYFINS